MRKIFKVILCKRTGLLNMFCLSAVFSGLFLAGCNNENSVDAAGGNAKISGRVTNESGFGKINGTSSSVEGASITLVKVKADGSLETVSKNEVVTDAGGKFTIETGAEGESNLVVVAKKGTSEWKAVVTSTIKSGITIYSQPLNDETTAEARVYSDVKAKNYNKVYYADVAAYINSNVASQIKNDASLSAKIADALNVKAEAYVKAVTREDMGGNTSRWNSVISAYANAQASLERDLFYAQNEAAVEGAYTSYFDAVVNAYVNAGLSAESYSKALEISDRVFVKNISSLNAQTRFELKKRAAQVKARVINLAVQSKFSAMAATSVQMNAVINAGVELNASVKSASTESEIISAFEAYQIKITDQLRISLSVQAAVFNTLEASIGGYKTALRASVAASTSTDTVIDAYISFYTNVKNSVDAILNTANNTQLKAAASLLIFVNMNF